MSIYLHSNLPDEVFKLYQEKALESRNTCLGIGNWVYFNLDRGGKGFRGNLLCSAPTVATAPVLWENSKRLVDRASLMSSGRMSGMKTILGKRELI